MIVDTISLGCFAYCSDSINNTEISTASQIVYFHEVNFELKDSHLGYYIFKFKNFYIYFLKYYSKNFKYRILGEICM